MSSLSHRSRPSRAVVKVLTQNRIGAVPVINEEGQLIGIISERDIIRGMSEHAEAVLALPADQLMTRDVKTCSSEDELVDLMEVMTLQRIRHLPVIREWSTSWNRQHRRRREAASRRGPVRSGATPKLYSLAVAATV